jgi:hypothetical protein
MTRTRLTTLAILLAIIVGIVLLERDGCSDCSMRSDGEAAILYKGE